MTTQESGFKDRLLQLIEGDSVSSFGRKCGIGESTLRKYLKGAAPRLDKLLAIREAADVNMEWLAMGKEPMRPGDKNATSAQVNHLETPLIEDIKLWLREMTSDDPGWPAWFEIELARKIPEFKEWRKKNQTDNNDQEAAAG